MSVRFPSLNRVPNCTDGLCFPRCTTTSHLLGLCGRMGCWWGGMTLRNILTQNVGIWQLGKETQHSTILLVYCTFEWCVYKQQTLHCLPFKTFLKIIWIIIYNGKWQRLDAPRTEFYTITFNGREHIITSLVWDTGRTNISRLNKCFAPFWQRRARAAW